jgi:hypothetical protein
LTLLNTETWTSGSAPAALAWFETCAEATFRRLSAWPTAPQATAGAGAWA